MMAVQRGRSPRDLAPPRSVPLRATMRGNNVKGENDDGYLSGAFAPRSFASPLRTTEATMRGNYIKGENDDG